MNSSPEQFEVPEPSWRVYLFASILAAAVGGALSAIWLPAGFICIAALLAAFASLLGVFQMECIGAAIWQTAIMAVIIAVLPKWHWIVLIVIPILTGHQVGELVCGVWKERR